MTIAANSYKKIIFDCDGVLLDSNHIKQSAFYDTVASYGKTVAYRFLEYVYSTAGVSRFVKFRHFIENILKQEFNRETYDNLLNSYNSIVKQKLLNCSETEGATNFIRMLNGKIRKFVISAGMQEEVREILIAHNMLRFFNAVWGSPATKEDIISREIGNGTIKLPAIFLGDTQYDYECATQFGLDFIFMYQYSTFSAWRDYFSLKNLKIIRNLADIHLLTNIL